MTKKMKPNEKQKKLLQRRYAKQESFICKSKKIHNNRYDYSLVDYVRSSFKVIIICLKHGEFLQTPKKHLKGQNCPRCVKNSKRLSEDFIEQAMKIHDEKYDYSLVNIFGSKTNVKIICSIHGVFEQTTSNHLAGKGCRFCKTSKGENKISILLSKHGIEYETQKTFDDCKLSKKLRFDFYLPKQNICIEFDGLQHFKPVLFNGIKLSKAKMVFKENQLRDSIKNQFCIDNNIGLIRIAYNENIFDRLNAFLKVSNNHGF